MLFRSITIDYGKQTPVNATSHRGSRTTSYIVNGLHRTPKPMDKSFDAVSYTHLYPEIVVLIFDDIVDEGGSQIETAVAVLQLFYQMCIRDRFRSTMQTVYYIRCGT